jgi:hypothetical protein
MMLVIFPSNDHTRARPGRRGQPVDVLRTVWTTQHPALPTLAHKLPTPARNHRHRTAQMPFGPGALHLPKQIFVESNTNPHALRAAEPTATAIHTPHQPIDPNTSLKTSIPTLVQTHTSIGID